MNLWIDAKALRVTIHTAGHQLYTFDFKVAYADSREIRVTLIDAEKDGRTIDERSVRNPQASEGAQMAGASSPKTTPNRKPSHGLLIQILRNEPNVRRFMRDADDRIGCGRHMERTRYIASDPPPNRWSQGRRPNRLSLQWGNFCPIYDKTMEG